MSAEAAPESGDGDQRSGPTASHTGAVTQNVAAGSAGFVNTGTIVGGVTVVAGRSPEGPTAAVRGPSPRPVAEVDFVELGVHPALGLPDAQPAEAGRHRSWYPPYVPRDCDGLIDQALAGGGLIIVEGRSGTGKSRAAAEAVRRVAADRQLLIPANRAELAALSEPPGRLRDVVVWLDNLELYCGPDGFGLPMLRRICPPGRDDVVVLATLRSQERRRLESPQGPVSVNSAAAGDALRVATVIRPELQFSSAERDRAAEQRADPRIADWLDRGGSTGLAEYLAAGPPAVTRWLAERGGENMLGAALVSAAVDCRRLFYTEPLPLDLLTELAQLYLDPRDAHRPGQPGIEQALAWATEPVSGASSCLLPWDENRYWAFDYLVDYMQRDPDAPEVPEEVARTLLSRVPDDDAPALIVQFLSQTLNSDTPRLADMALLRHGRLSGFDEVWQQVMLMLVTSSFGNRGPDWTYEARLVRWLRPFAEDGNPIAMTLLGHELAQRGDTEQAESWLRRAADAGEIDAVQAMARLLLDTGRAEELNAWVETAVAQGRGRGIGGFVAELIVDDQRAAAKHWCQRAADLGDTDAMVVLAVLCSEDGDWAEAQARLTTSAEAGNPLGMYNLALVLKPLIGRLSEAEDWLRRSAEVRYAPAVADYAQLLHEHGDKQGLEQWLERERAAGDTAHILEFAGRLAAADDMDSAEHWYRQAMEMGDVEAVKALGDVRFSRGDNEGAAAFYRQAIDKGNVPAMLDLAYMYFEPDPAKAEEMLRTMLKDVHVFAERPEADEKALTLAAFDLGWLLARRGQTAEAETWYETAAYRGNTDAMHNLARLLEKRGETDSARRWFGEAAEAGDEGAADALRRRFG